MSGIERLNGEGRGIDAPHALLIKEDEQGEHHSMHRCFAIIYT